MATTEYTIKMATTPGAAPVAVARARTLRKARTEAKRAAFGRRDLTHQDVRIERPDGSLVEYAGPAR